MARALHVALANQPDWRVDRDAALEKARRTADNLKLCSCWMCGNPRRFFKGVDRLRIGERRFLTGIPSQTGQ